MSFSWRMSPFPATRSALSSLFENSILRLETVRRVNNDTSSIEFLSLFSTYFSRSTRQRRSLFTFTGSWTIYWISDDALSIQIAAHESQSDRFLKEELYIFWNGPRRRSKKKGKIEFSFCEFPRRFAIHSRRSIGHLRMSGSLEFNQREYGMYETRTEMDIYGNGEFWVRGWPSLM